jgi:diguanylate cyclase (GGDEF)-like protein/PAS domain S-box-containing protein
MLPTPAPSRLLFLDLRTTKLAPQPEIEGIEAINPSAENDCDDTDTALLVMVAIDTPATYEDWRQRFHPMCPSGFPHLVLLDPYNPELARQSLQDDAADCCAMVDLERIQLIIKRLQRGCGASAPQPAEQAGLLLRIQTSIDTLPSPIFIKDGGGRYIACNKAFEDYLGLARSRIIGSTVYDIAPPELARVYEKADLELLAQGGTQSYEAQVRYADGSFHDVIFRKSVFLDANGVADGISGTMLDITDRKLLEEKLAVAASTDFLTGISNLRTFHELGGQEFRRFVRSGGDLSLIVIDMDHFKDINDRLGHAAGDEALCLFVAEVRKSLREQDIFARTGGDEFRLILPETMPASAALVAERIRQAVNQLQVSSPGGTVNLSISAGICSCLPGDQDLDDVTRRADAALYKAKVAGRNCVQPQFFTK